MISWATIFYGDALTVLFAVGAVAVIVRERRLDVLAAVVVAAVAGPVGWNAILHTTDAANFFVDAPVAVFPISWQDFGTGVFTLASASLLLGAGPLRSAPPARSVYLY